MTFRDEQRKIADHPVVVVIEALVHLVLIAALIVVMAEVGCDDSKKAQSRRVWSELYYFKDIRTGLCFASSDHFTSGYMATVPCDKVKKYLVYP